MIDSTHFNLAILLMAMITFTVRYVFFTRLFEIKLTDTLRRILLFTAPCILTAMFVPIMFQEGLTQSAEDTKNLALIFTSSYFWGSVFAIICSLLIRNTLAVIILSLIFFYGFRYFL